MLTEKVKGYFLWAVVLSLAAFLVWLTWLPTLNRIELQEDEYVRKANLLRRLQALPTEEAAIRERLETLSSEAAARLLYSGEHNSTLSMMQRDVRQLAATHNINLSSVRTLANFQQPGPIQRSALQLNLVTDQKGLVQFLAAIEQAEPLLRVKRLTVRVRRPSTEYSAAELSVLMEIGGFRQVGGDR